MVAVPRWRAAVFRGRLEVLCRSHGRLQQRGRRGKRAVWRPPCAGDLL